jgi:aminoglycoside phosphotransferase (APT) family kinase protein
MTSWPAALEDAAEELEAVCARAFGGAAVVAAEPAPGGHSGFTFFLELDRAPGAAVVRISPPGARPVGPADMVRQGRIMAALHAAGIPVPEVIASVGAEETRSRRPFVVLSRVEGLPVEVAAAEQPPERLLGAAIEVLGAISVLPAKATGIGEEERQGPLWQVDRWEPLMARGPTELTPRGPELAAALRSAAPTTWRAGLIHGHYQFGNLLFRDGRVAAVLDWEIAELGPPEVDLACLCVTAIRRGLPGINPGGEVTVSPDSVLEAAGRIHAGMDWYIAAACYKYAAILAYNLDLHLRGKRVDVVYEGLRGTITGLLEAGLALTPPAIQIS